MTVCPLSATGLCGSTWPCVRAAGHDGVCDPGPEGRAYVVPLATHDADWLRSEVIMLHGRIESMKRDVAADPTPARLRRLISGLVQLAPANATRKNVATADVQTLWQEALNG